MKKIKFKQSKNGGLNVPINWIIENAYFAYTHFHHNGERPHVVTRIKWEDMWNCFEIDTYSDGIRVSGASEYNGWEDVKEVTDKNIDEFVWKKLDLMGCDVTINMWRHYQIVGWKRLFRALFKSDIVQIIITGIITYLGYYVLKYFFD